jgi:hypothetical protein
VSAPGEAIDAELRAVFAGLADVLIPADDRMPSAGEVALERGALDAVLAFRPDVTADLARLLEAARGTDPAAEVARLRDDDEEGFQLLTTVVGGGYFLDEGVRAAIGYRGQEAVPIERMDPPDYEREGLLASVVERGPIYRPTPAE